MAANDKEYNHTNKPDAEGLKTSMKKNNGKNSQGAQRVNLAAIQHH
jgi:hypothetical protein